MWVEAEFKNCDEDLGSKIFTGTNCFGGDCRWLNSMNGEKGIKKPTSLVEILLGNETDEESIIETFDSGQDFNDEWIRLTRGEK